MKMFSEIYSKSFERVMDKVNNIIEKLFEKIEQEDISLESFYKISAAIDDLITFTKEYAFPLMMNYINNQDLLKEKLGDDFVEFRNSCLKIFADIEASLVNIENNLKNDDGKIDFSALKNYLEFIGVLFNNFGHIFLVTIYYANNKIDEDEYRREYEKFKENLNVNQDIFDKKFED